MTTARQLALRLARHIGVSSFDPGHGSNNSPLHQPGVRRGDLVEIAACLNTALYELRELAGKSEEENCAAMVEVRPSDIGVTDDPRVPLRALEQMEMPRGWALEVVFPLALERLLLHPDFESRLAKEEVARQAEQARATVRRAFVRRIARDGKNRIVPVFR